MAAFLKRGQVYFIFLKKTRPRFENAAKFLFFLLKNLSRVLKTRPGFIFFIKKTRPRFENAGKADSYFFIFFIKGTLAAFLKRG